MKLEKKVQILNYGFNENNCNYDFLLLNPYYYFEENEKDFIIRNKDKRLKLTLEVEEPILDDEERKYLSGFIKPFRDEIECIRKVPNEYYKAEHLVIYFKDNMNMPFPYFKKGSMYKGMKVDKDYTLDGLCL